jgi:TonB family protein
MLLAWMTYALLVALLATAAALTAERLLPRRGRWIWAAALGLGWGIPLVRGALARWSRSGDGVSVVLGPMAPVMDAALSNLGAVATSPAAGRLDVPVAVLWLAVSVALSVFLGLGWLRLRLQERRWRLHVVDGTPVRVSEDVGPAVVGVFDPRIVVPRWVLELPEADRRLILAHEREHRAKGDPALLAGALVLTVLAPWNPLLWMAFFRLRHAVEVDCDARVVSADRDSLLGYAQLLFHVGTMPDRPIPLGAGFGERRSSLERRIRAMLEENARDRLGPTAVRVALAAVLILAACSLEVNIDRAASGDAAASLVAAEVSGDAAGTAAPGATVDELLAKVEELETTVQALKASIKEEVVIPPPPPPVDATGGRPKVSEKTRSELESFPTFTPFTVAPTIMNRDEVVASMEASYPKLLRDAGIGGTVRVYFFIDESGHVNRTLIDQTSGHPALDDAALHVASVYRFKPALNREQVVPVWVSFPITFRVR